MAKKENDAVATAENGVLVITGENGKEVNAEQLLAQMKEAQVGNELTSEYFTLEPGENARVVLLEMTEMSKMGGQAGETTDAVKLLTSDGVIAICADKVVVSTARSLFAKGKINIPVEVTCTGKKQGQNGKYKEWSIKSLLM